VTLGDLLDQAQAQADTAFGTAGSDANN